MKLWRHGLRDLAVQGLVVSVGLVPCLLLFALQDALYFRPAALSAIDRVVAVRSHLPVDPTSLPMRAADVAVLQEGLKTMDVAGFAVQNCTLKGGEWREVVPCARVTPGFAQVMDTRPLLGSWPDTSSDDLQPIAIGEAFWRRVLRAEGSAIGSAIELTEPGSRGAPPRTRFGRIVVVLPRSFQVPSTATVWWPLSRSEVIAAQQDGILTVWGRLRPGVSHGSVRSELEGAEGWAFRTPDLRFEIQPLREVLASPAARSVGVLLVAAISLVVVAWLHVLCHLTVKASMRATAHRVQAILGASTVRLMAPWLVVSAGVCVVGWIGGLVLANGLLPFFVEALPFAAGRVVGIDERATAVGGLVDAVCAALVAAALWRVIARDAGEMTVSGRDTWNEPKRPTLGPALCLSISLGMGFLYIAILLGGAALRLYQIHPGFDATNLTAVKVRFAAGVRPAERDAALNGLVRSLAEVPGIVQVTRAQGVPFGTWQVRTTVRREGGTSVVAAKYKTVRPDYFATLRVAVQGLPDLGSSATSWGAGAGPSVVINKALSTELWGTESPIGQGLSFDGHSYVVAGVCDDFRDEDLQSAEGFQVYRLGNSGTDLLLRSGDTVQPPTRASLTSIASAFLPDAAIAFESYRDKYSDLTRPHRAVASFVLVLAISALIICFAGVWAQLSYTLVARARTVAICWALGGTRWTLMRQVFSGSSSWAVGGLAVGLLAGVLGASFCSDLLMGLSPFEPTALMASLMAGLVGLSLASLPPVRALGQMTHAAPHRLLALRDGSRGHRA